MVMREESSGTSLLNVICGQRTDSKTFMKVSFFKESLRHQTAHLLVTNWLGDRSLQLLPFPLSGWDGLQIKGTDAYLKAGAGKPAESGPSKKSKQVL